MTKYFSMLMAFIFMFTLTTVSAIAGDLVGSPVPGEQIVDSIVNFISSPSGIVMSAAIVEFLLRVFKSTKALGILHFVGRCLVVFGNLAVKLGEASDKILPQNVAKK
jgi:hypothetical protein